MAEYIERGKIGLTDFEIAMCNGDYKKGLKMLLDKIESIPAADVRPVVLCKDCKYWEIDWIPRGVSDGRHYCAPLDLYPSADWFCADGEKREES